MSKFADITCDTCLSEIKVENNKNLFGKTCSRGYVNKYKDGLGCSRWTPKKHLIFESEKKG